MQTRAIRWGNVCATKLAGAVVAFIMVLASDARAVDTTRLWSERGAQELPLAQVPDFRRLAAQVVPSVASIQTEQKVRGTGGIPGFPGMGGPNGGQDPFDFFHRFFGGEMPREYRNRGLGSGFVIDAKGLVLTNFHVVENADVIEVTLTSRDGVDKKYTAKVLGTAPEYDVALLQTSETLTDPTLAYLGDSETAQIGDWVMAVGNPFGLTHSVSVGIISAKERRDVAPSGRTGIYNFLQTDASINPGNSGGPLVNMRGEVIGINSAVNASGAGIGFAIPINMVKQMLPDLQSKGHYVRSWIGVKIQPMTDELAQSYGLSRAMGALVAEVMPNSPAAEAKLREGDVVLSFDGKPVRAANDLTLYAAGSGVGKSAVLKIWRDGKEMSTAITLRAFPEAEALVDNASPTGQDTGALGLAISDLTPGLRQQLEVGDVQGAVVRTVADGGLAMRAGLRQGDVITSIGGRATPNRRAVVEAIRRAKAKQMLRLRIVRGGSSIFVALQKP